MTDNIPLLTLVNRAAQMRQGIKDVLTVLNMDSYPDMDMIKTMLKGLIEDDAGTEGKD